MLTTPLQHALVQSSGASFAVLLWEWAITFDDEVEFIWPKSNVSWLKWSYFCSRYFVLVVHFANRTLEVSLNYYYLNHSFLRGWYVGQVVLAAVAISSLELVLMARVYALYNQPRWLASLLLGIFVCEIGLAILGLFLTIPRSHFVPSMIITRLPASFAYYGIASVVVQAILLAFTVRKYAQSSLSAIPLVKVMMRDGTFAFCMLTIFATAVVIHTLRHYPYAATGYAWLLTCVSSVTCRIIVNMQRIHIDPDGVDASTAIVFTTVFTDQITFEDFNTYSTYHGRTRQFTSMNAGSIT
ncbi:hypothetical protein CPC08DRAFT_682004 [Agrocybe pediades]|nr:hypothetical protein CPC08DRAFT_682004 [Agrocybe pediades]